MLKSVRSTLAELGVRPHNTVFVSGIGCAARFPYYMETYGFHTIHGRAPAVATGLKITNPELDIWVISGDGDSLSIGGNHLLHVLRRNVDLQFLLFNNEIYGLTKGQYSPTSKVGTRSPSTPDGSVDLPLTPCVFAIGSGARFVARSIDTEMKHLTSVLTEAHAHIGASFVEIYQNCPVYNDGIFDDVKEKKQAADTRLVLEHGKPLLFGKESQKGIRLNAANMALEIVTIGEDGVSESDVLVHDETNKVLAQMLAELKGPEFPVPVGVIKKAPATAYVDDVYSQRIAVREKKGKADLNALLRTGHTWTVE